MGRRHELDAQRAQLSDLVGQTVTGVELADGGALGIRFTAGEIVILATIQQEPRGGAPRLVIDWQTAPDRGWDGRAGAISCVANPAAGGFGR